MKIELNNVQKDSELFNGKFNKSSSVVEIFSAMVNGESLNRFGAKADKAVSYIRELGERAGNGDTTAAVELNTLRRFVVEGPIMEEMKLLGIFGTYQAVGFDETIEREVYDYAGERSRIQAANGDVVFPATTKKVYPVPTFTVSGGYAVDYRRIANGDMSKEYDGMQIVKNDILNNAKKEIFKKIIKAIAEASGVKHYLEANTLTKTAVDNELTKIRRYGRPTIAGDYAVLSQFTPWAGYVGNISNVNVTGVSQKALEEIAQNGLLSAYNGCVLSEIENPYNEFELTDDGQDFKTLLPAGAALIIPTGIQSPIATWTRGGLTSFSGNDVKTGHVMTRFDIEVAADIAKGREHMIGVIYDSSIGGLD